MNRIQKSKILQDLEKKIVLLVGPRQAGKTWLAKDIAAEFERAVYLNYDQVQDREIMQAQSWLPTTDLLILDELHKMDGWKNYLKGVYDTKKPSMRILVTGSARLNIYDQLGDSLAGRYFRSRLLPFSLAELKQLHQEVDINRLITRGGFPEPYLAATETEADRWRMQYTNKFIISKQCNLCLISCVIVLVPQFHINHWPRMLQHLQQR
jgi:predicted AAA+ superfamily ATPase